MGFLESFTKGLVNRMAFERGKSGDAPMNWTDPDLQKVADKAYQAGQEIRKTEILVTLDKKLKGQ